MRIIAPSKQRKALISDCVTAGLLWVALATLSGFVRDNAGAILLVWLPSGVVVAALRGGQRKQWPFIMAALGIFIFLWVVAYGRDALTAIAYSVSSLVAAWVCVALGVRILGPKKRLPDTLAQIAGMFAAALAGSAIGTAIALPFLAEPSFAEIAWWFLANALSMLAVAPMLVSLRQLIRTGKPLQREHLKPRFLFAAAMMVLFSATILNAGSLALMPLLIGMVIIATIRYGQIGTAVATLAFAGGAALVSLNGETPTIFGDLSADEARLIMQQWMLIMLAISLPISAMLMRREQLEAKLLQRNRDLRQSLTIFDLAEDLAGVGRWRFDLRTGAQEWSESMLELNGLARDLAPDPGDIRDLMPDQGQTLFDRIAAHRADWEPYSFNYSVVPEGGNERILRISILNEFDAEGERVALFGVAMDVTDQVRREEALDKARGRAVKLAAEAQHLANTDPLTGLPNRRCTLARLKSLVEKAKSGHSSLAVVMFDIDHFKAVNDGFGHQTGDDVLVHIAAIARKHVRQNDLVGRIGGEEFIWLIPGAGQDEAQKMAERLRSSIEVMSGIAGLPEVTASVGLSVYRRGDDEESLLMRCDEALYAAKHAGRNRVRLAA